MKSLRTLAATWLLVISTPVYPQTVEDLLGTLDDGVATLSAEDLNSEEQEYVDWTKQIVDSLNPRTGLIELGVANATLNIPESFYYLGPADSKTVLEDLWANPPGNEVLGMIFPAGATPLDEDTWGVTIEYLDDGYVSDEDAAEIDYTELLQDMQDSTRADSKERVEAGYEAFSLIGWASPPYYDSSTNKLHWAQELAFGDSETNTLNYNIRVLGRKGLLRMNFIASMDQLDTIKANVDTVLELAEFDSGATYAEFDPSMDKVAAYGIGALVAGKVIAKTGLIAVALIFLKKFGVLILVGGGALVARIFKKKSKDESTDDDPTAV